MQDERKMYEYYKRDILDCVKHNDYDEAGKWLKKAYYQLMMSTFRKLLTKIKNELDPEQYASIVDEAGVTHLSKNDDEDDDNEDNDDENDDNENDDNENDDNEDDEDENDDNENDDNENDDNENDDNDDDDDEANELPIDIVHRKVCFSGSGPYDETLFNTMLEKMGIKVSNIDNPEIDVIILGQSDWDDASLYVHIQECRGKHLRVYSQEMFLYLIAVKEDPYCYPDLLSEFGESHPALQRVLECGFNWIESTYLDYVQEKLLPYMGYFGETDSHNTDVRRNLLNTIMERELPIVISISHMEVWGEPMTMLRLEKLANNIASHVMNAKKQDQPPLNDINYWEKDLEWLRKRYYNNNNNNNYTFKWPNTEIMPSHDNLAVTDTDWPDEGLLSFKGYHVGATKGLDAYSRRSILDEVMQNSLPNVISVEHMKEWGEPMVETRLKKLAQSIATFAKNAKRRKTDSFDEAIEDWESDLAWLKEKYYNPGLTFRWPST